MAIPGFLLVLCALFVKGYKLMDVHETENGRHAARDCLFWATAYYWRGAAQVTVLVCAGVLSGVSITGSSTIVIELVHPGARATAIGLMLFWPNSLVFAWARSWSAFYPTASVWARL